MMYLIFIFLLSPIAFAQNYDEQRAEELYLNGELLFKEQEYRAAITAWEEGYAMSNLPDFLKNIALAYEALEEYDKAIEVLTQYRAVASFSHQEGLKKWIAELEEKQAAAEKIAQEQEREAQQKEEEQKKKEAEQKEAEQRQKEYDLAREQEILRQKEELLEREKELAKQEIIIPKTKQSSRLPLWSSVAGTALASGATVYFSIDARRQKQSIEQYCEWNSGFCLSSNTAGISMEPNFSIEDNITAYNRSKRGQLISSGLVLTVGSLAVWQVSKNISATPNAIVWSTTW